MIGPVRPKVGDVLYLTDGTVSISGWKILDETELECAFIATNGHRNVLISKRKMWQLTLTSPSIYVSKIVLRAEKDIVFKTADQTRQILKNSDVPYGPEWQCKSHWGKGYRYERNCEGVYICPSCEAYAKMESERARKLDDEEFRTLGIFKGRSITEKQERRTWPAINKAVKQ